MIASNLEGARVWLRLHDGATQDRVCFRCEVTADYGDVTVQASAAGFDAAVAGWQAFHEIEDQLRIGTDLTKVA